MSQTEKDEWKEHNEEFSYEPPQKDPELWPSDEFTKLYDRVINRHVKWVCQQCNEPFSRLETARRHVRNRHHSNLIDQAMSRIEEPPEESPEDTSEESDDDQTTLTDGGQYVDEYDTHLDEDGLWIPPRFRKFTGQIVFRTPKSTIQHFQSGGGELDAYYGMIDEGDFGHPDELTDPRNPELAPDKISIKPQGVDAKVLRVKIHPELRTDGGAEKRAENVEVVRVEDFVELRIDGRDDLAMPFKPEHATQLAMNLMNAATDAKRYQQERSQ